MSFLPRARRGRSDGRGRKRAAAPAAAACLSLVSVSSQLRSSRALTVGELLDCDGDPEWVTFRYILQVNAAEGFPVDPELAFIAQELLQKYEAEVRLDPESAYFASSGMRDFFSSCNAPPEEPTESFCLYGAVSALWVIARSGPPERRHGLLQLAEFLLGKTMRITLDFTEGTEWPITSLDIFANLQQDPDDDFLLPSDLRELRPPQLVPRFAQASSAPAFATRASASTARDGAARLVVWEVGVHASLSAEPLQMWARSVPRAKFVHRNLIRDQYPKWLPDKCETLYSYPRLECDDVEDEITDLFRRRIPYSATSKDPIGSMGDFVAEFREVAAGRLAEVDIFLCTVAYLCLFAEEMDIPVLGYFGHPLLFMVPLDAGTREDFWPRFVALASKPNVGLAVSDPFLQMQYDYQVGSPRLPAIRTHALYTGVTHFPARLDEVLVMDRPHECVLMCLIMRTMQRHAGDDSSDLSRQDEWPTEDGRLRAAGAPGYPYRFLTRALTDRSFRTFAQFRAVVLWAYDMDLITFYEFYSMGMPIFMPASLSKYLFQQDHMSYDGKWAGRRYEDRSPPLWPEEAGGASPFEEWNLNAVRYTVGFSDYFRFPDVQYFESIADLIEKLPGTDFFEVAQNMARFNQESLVETSAAWRSLLRRTTGWDRELFQW